MDRKWPLNVRVSVSLAEALRARVKRINDDRTELGTSLNKEAEKALKLGLAALELKDKGKQ